MGVDYQYLTGDDQAALLEQRLRSLEAAHFEQALNLAALKAATDVPAPQKKEQTAQITAALATIERSITQARADLAKIQKG